MGLKKELLPGSLRNSNRRRHSRDCYRPPFPLRRHGFLPASAVGWTLLKLGSFLGILLVAGLIVVPRLLNYVARFKSNEMLLVAVLGLCFGVSLLAVQLGYSVALGAFLIGAIMAEARQIARIETLLEPVRDMFSAVFSSRSASSSIPRFSRNTPGRS